jgi:hypothetical protein
VQKGKFEKFFAPSDPFLANLAEKANALREDPTTDLGKPGNIEKLTNYHFTALSSTATTAARCPTRTDMNI